ncbi:hypothetical protein GOV13_00575 [Candidatus Pacearchaeota archaeon]|nr:hypothetical protein [Candidatus Pacearchaeota archaeon]
MELEVGDILLCTVERIAGTMVFVRIDDTGQQGSIILSEIAPGRIRNLRDYVVPKKKIICKILRISPNGNIDLSLRRVTKKEQQEIRDSNKQEKSSKSILKSVLGDKSKDVVNEILEQDKVSNFLQEAKENSKNLEKIVGKDDAKKILDILNTQKQKKAVVKKTISLTTSKPNGLELIKKILGKIKEAEIRYISAGKYSVKTEASDIKTADNMLKEVLSKIEKTAKKEHVEFGIK